MSDVNIATKRPLNIVFAGTPEFGISCLSALHEAGHHLTAIYTQPDRPSGRGQKMQMSPIKLWAMAHDVPVLQPANFKSEDAVDTLRQLKPDVLVVIAYGLILPKAVLDVPRLGCVNVHASLLPRWRGASPIQHAILHGDAQTGVTIMMMDVGMDSGAMLEWRACDITNDQTAGQLHDVLQSLAVEPLLSTLDRLSLEESFGIAQDETQVTFAPKIKKEDAHIDWQQSAQCIVKLIRAYHPWPSAYAMWHGTPMKIHQAKPVQAIKPAPAGTVMAIDKAGILVATSDGGLLIETIQFPGGKILPVAQWYHTRASQYSVMSVLQ